MTENFEAAFHFPCTERKCCENYPHRHGHLVLSCEDGIGFVPAPIASRCCFVEVVTRITCLQSQEQLAIITRIVNRLSLPMELLEEERAMFASASALEDALRFGFWSGPR